jgi:branched-chain amino acid transport system substrate-binding protein
MLGRLRLWWVLLAVAFVAFAGASACAGGGGGEEDGATPAAEASPTAGETAEPTTIVSKEDILRKDPGVTKTAEIEWGFMFELSGTLAAFGEPTGDGVKMAVQEINDAGGFQVGDTIYTIKLIEHDTRTDINQTIAVAAELVRDTNVKVIWGPASTGETETTAITQPRQILHLCPCEGRELTALSSVEQAQGESHWAFQTLPPITALFPQGAADLPEQFPEFKTFAIVCRNDDTGRRVCPALVDAYLQAGYEQPINADDLQVDALATDFRPVLTRIKARDPDILLNFIDPFNQGAFLKQALELGIGRYYGAVVLPPNLLEAAVGDPRIHDVYIGWGGYPRQQIEPTSEKARAYFAQYSAYKGGNLPLVPFVSLLTYDFVFMVVAAMQQAATVDDTTAIADALEEVHYNGVGEDDIYFNSQHIGVMGGDGCTVYQRQVTCEHGPPPEQIKD